MTHVLNYALLTYGFFLFLPSPCVLLVEGDDAANLDPGLLKHYRSCVKRAYVRAILERIYAPLTYARVGFYSVVSCASALFS